jgi:hypothetical protein
MECTKCSAFKLTVNGVCYECRTFQLLNPKLIKINLLNSRHGCEESQSVNCEESQSVKPKLIKINLLNSRHGCEESQSVKPKLIKINLLNSRHRSSALDTGFYLGEIPNPNYLAKRS